MELILLIGAFIVFMLVVSILTQAVKATISVALTIVVALLLLYFLFGPGPIMRVWQPVTQVFQSIWQVITGR